MSQPPPGGFSPPDEPDTGPQPGQPQPGQQSGSSPAGAQQPPAAPGSNQPPPGYQPGPPPGYQPPPAGYQQGQPQGYQAPPAGYQQGPPPGYGPPPGQSGSPAGYGPPQGTPAAYGPPGQYAPQGAYPPPPGGGVGPKASFDPSKVSIAGWGVLGASLLTLIASFFNFYSVSYSGFVAVSYGINGWSSWWWIPVLLAVAVGVIYGLQLFGVLSNDQVKPEWLVYGAAASFVLMIGVLIHTFVAGPSSADLGDLGGAYSAGPGFGAWFALITTLVLTYFTALAAQSAGAKLPFKVPGPA